MASPTPRMDAAQFDRVASKCRWSERSLGVVRALLVDGLSLPDAVAAVTPEMSVKQARVLRDRFNAKAESQRLEEFMQREKPKLATTALEPYSSEVRTLRDKGYTIEQIVAFFKANGVKTSPTTVRKFLRSIRA